MLVKTTKVRGWKVAILLLASAFSVPAVAHLQQQPERTVVPQISVDWDKALLANKTSVTIQVWGGPPMMRGGPIHRQAHDALRNLRADYARLQPWFPLPRLSMAALEPPSNGKTYWDFSLIDPMVLDFYAAAEGRPIMLNMAIPDWLFKGPREKYSDDPYEINWLYEFGPNVGKELRDPTNQEAAGYFRRIAEWYIKGGFTDEYGKRHVSGHKMKIDYWEVLNEQDEVAHDLDPPTYTRIYDSVVKELQKVDPSMKYSGLALHSPENLHYFEYFLNSKNHEPGIPIDMVSFHEYIVARPEKHPTRWADQMFDDADNFTKITKKIVKIRDRLSPHTKLFVSEWGVMWAPETDRIYAARRGTPYSSEGASIPDNYWQIGAAVWGYGYLNVQKLGVDLVAAAELVNYPSMYAGTNLVHWETGEPNAVYHVVKLFRDRINLGDKLVETRTENSDVTAQGFAGSKGKTLLLINRSNAVQPVSLPTTGKALRVYTVSERKGDGTKPEIWDVGDARDISLDPYAVVVVQWER